jgi:hypothetical protein
VSSGADVNARDEAELTPLYYAASNGRAEIVELLIGCGAHVDDADREGWTALSVAAKKGHLRVVELLIEKGANANIEVKNTYTPLNYAILNGHREVVERLLALEPGRYPASGLNCPACASREQKQVDVSFFVADKSPRRILACLQCKAIWTPSEIDRRVWLGMFFDLLVGGCFLISSLEDHRKAVFMVLGLILAGFWFYRMVLAFPRRRKPESIWIGGTAHAVPAD